jgi:hypothetical protein
MLFVLYSFSIFLTNEWYCRWLHAPREDGEPRVLYIGYDEENAMQFIDHIKKVNNNRENFTNYKKRSFYVRKMKRFNELTDIQILI